MTCMRGIYPAELQAVPFRAQCQLSSVLGHDGRGAKDLIMDFSVFTILTMFNMTWIGTHSFWRLIRGVIDGYLVLLSVALCP